MSSHVTAARAASDEDTELKETQILQCSGTESSRQEEFAVSSWYSTEAHEPSLSVLTENHCKVLERKSFGSLILFVSLKAEKHLWLIQNEKEWADNGFGALSFLLCANIGWGSQLNCVVG